MCAQPRKDRPSGETLAYGPSKQMYVIYNQRCLSSSNLKLSMVRPKESLLMLSVIDQIPECDHQLSQAKCHCKRQEILT